MRLRVYSSKGRNGIWRRIVSASGQIFRLDFRPQDEIFRPGMEFRPLDEQALRVTLRAAEWFFISRHVLDLFFVQQDLWILSHCQKSHKQIIKFILVTLYLCQTYSHHNNIYCLTKNPNFEKVGQLRNICCTPMLTKPTLRNINSIL